MKIVCSIILFICAHVVWGVLANSDWSIPPSTVTQLNPDAYMGRWYLMYSSLIPKSTFLYDGYCVTGDYYGLQVEGSRTTFQATNSMR